jgi:hypothetical protein
MPAALALGCANSFRLFDCEHDDMGSLPYARDVAQLLATGVQRSWEFGYHGTSAETIVTLAETGRMPTTGTSGTEFYVYMSLRSRRWAHETAESQASEEATCTASWVHAAAAELQRSPQDILHAVTKYSDDEIREYGLGELPSEAAVETIRERVFRSGRKGVLVAIKAKTRGQMGLPSGWERKLGYPEEAFFDSAGGLRIDQIRRIAPLSVADRDFIVQALK